MDHRQTRRGSARPVSLLSELISQQLALASVVRIRGSRPDVALAADLQPAATYIKGSPMPVSGSM
jgi:hypothetical protein